jgi:hypothetical protein
MTMDPQPGLAAETPSVGAPSQVWHRPQVTVPLFVMFALVGAFFPSFSLIATVYVIAVGGALFWLGLSGRVVKRASPDRVPGAGAWWLLPAGLFVVVEVTNFAYGSTYPHPTLSVLLDTPLEHYSLRSLAYFIWLSAYWGLIYR